MKARWIGAVLPGLMPGLLLVVTACGGPPNATMRAGGALKAYDINLVARDRVSDGGTLRWGLTEYPVQWNQHHIDGNHADVKTVMDALLPHAFRSDERANIRVDRDYVISAEVTATTPRQVVTYTLNPAAKWSDGKPITYADYVAQWQALRGVNTAYRVATVTGYQDITGVAKGKNAYEVVVTFARPFGDWRSLFSPLYPASANATPEAFNSAWTSRIPVTAGPFKFAAFDHTAKTVTIARDNAWWGDRAKLDKIIFRGLESDARIGAFANGELDVFDIGPSAPDYARARSTQGGVVRQAAAPDFRHLTFNGESPMLSDVRVRQAIALSVDRRVIAQSDLQGLNWPATLLDNHFLMNSQEGYQPNAGSLGKLDPARASRLLDEAGWKMTGATRARNGRELAIRFVIPSGLQLAKSEGELVQAMLRPLGVRVTLQTVPSGDFFTKYVIPGNYDIAPFSYVGTPFPVTSAYGTYANGVTGPGDDIVWNANLGRSGSREIDTALRQAAAELDPVRARAHLNAADLLVWQKVNVLTLYQRPQNVAVRANLANVGARGFRDLDYADIGFVGGHS
ncbi:ABC transporter family substrate-binding protein [Acrocarpospora pleiomorpha]|uniref:ABC transporter family substrate-binding protein n=1 Tax=Acrocarpospora pleiomorpha TaxID=90975 RepID=UPI001FE5A364|nr:ABC transporter family substrate-binding protein [Acrocarpospora pleiomorpha]